MKSYLMAGDKDTLPPCYSAGCNGGPCELVMGEQKLICECGVPRRDYAKATWQASGTETESN